MPQVGFGTYVIHSTMSQLMLTTVGKPSLERSRRRKSASSVPFMTDTET